MANQAWQITSAGTITLKDLTTPVGKPGPKQVLIRIHAVAFNYRDVLIADHSPNYPIQAKPDLIPCSDGAGIVEEAGSESVWTKGDRVMFLPNSWLSGADPRNFKLNEVLGGGDLDGTLRRWVVWDDDRLIKAPAGLSMEEAATIFTAGVTAWAGLFHGPMKLEPGMTVLTQGTGGVSCYGIQKIAAAAGATVVATSSSDEKLQVAKKLGAKHLINYIKTPDWSAEVLKATNGVGVDLVLDVVGAGSIEQTIKATRFGGFITILGLLTDEPTKKVDVVQDLLYGCKTMRGHLGAGNKEMGEELSVFMEKHQLHPPIAELFEFEEAEKALKASKKLAKPGKIVVRVG
ncbi:hypothetical protein LTR91_011309 [Friedmanniomyces endolithicus]|uniref:Enoyl reductase (ER) domain-containing protein n=1 Tax=Friedmanniomyces endolithicus TaxID=329885 RepID=A0AAN6QS19_9PEZI|nr:hypothetical protein LTS09_003845 [Friedmanniomyces endolithicus]KAK0271462.1 hypothetical protein LTR35_013500 [Friedmanniomyces endolithicus]KAK0280586.1 hypothetical protein LTS00_013015 [Friedmanniomyces endolithicus]KAK0983077.1 hypothetical protein LTR91_011309 [Friedmanniomyces endolithicus]KAK1012646.1 hypothetical protein LTR54_004573 [Friedmanniomyces endolithicus]